MPNFSNPPDSKEKSHECQFCDKKYFSRNALRNHERLKHEGKGKRTEPSMLALSPLVEIKSEKMDVSTNVKRHINEKFTNPVTSNVSDQLKVETSEDFTR